MLLFIGFVESTTPYFKVRVLSEECAPYLPGGNMQDQPQPMHGLMESVLHASHDLYLGSLIIRPEVAIPQEEVAVMDSFQPAPRRRWGRRTKVLTSQMTCVAVVRPSVGAPVIILENGSIAVQDENARTSEGKETVYRRLTEEAVAKLGYETHKLLYRRFVSVTIPNPTRERIAAF